MNCSTRLSISPCSSSCAARLLAAAALLSTFCVMSVATLAAGSEVGDSAGAITTRNIEMYGAEFAGQGSLFSVDVRTGSLSTIAPAGGFFAGMDASPAGSLWAASTSLTEIDPVTGATLANERISFRGGPGGDILVGLSFSPLGELYGIGNGNGNLWKLNTVNNEATFVGNSGEDIFALEFGPGGKLYGTGFSLWEINPATAAAVEIGGPWQGTGIIQALDHAADGNMYGASGSALYRVDLQFGSVERIGPTDVNLVSLASIAPRTPEFGSAMPPIATGFEEPRPGALSHDRSGDPSAVELSFAGTAGPGITNFRGDQAYLLNNGRLLLETELVDIRQYRDVQVSIDVRTWEDSNGSDFEDDDFITGFVRVSYDGLNFSDLQLIPRLTGDTGSLDALKELDGGPFGDFVTYRAQVPDDIATMQVIVEAANNSRTERFAFDNIQIVATPIPEPATLFVLLLGILGILGQRQRV